MEQWQKDGLDQLEKCGYIPVLRNLARSLAAPFWWYDPAIEIGSSIKHNGTICFLNTGLRTIGVTASHVYEQYLKDKENQPNIVCQIGSTTWIPERYNIGSEIELDIATFEIPEFLIAASHSSIHYPQQWPPNRLETGELVILGGFPGPLRSEHKESAEFPFVSFIARVAQHSESHASFQLAIENSHWPAGESLGSSPDLGGISGGPVYRINEKSIASIEIAGFIYEYGQNFELIRARHSLEISSEGRIEQLRFIV